MSAPKYRAMRYGITSVQVQTRDDGVQYVLADVPLGSYPVRMTDMMMTGRVYNAVDGERAGFAQYLVSDGTALAKAMELATHIAGNAPLTNYALMHALPRIAEQAADHGFVTESLMSSITQAAPEAKARVDAFLKGRAAKVEKKA